MNSWVIYNRRRGSAQFRLFLFAHAGGGARAFWGWNNRLSDEIELGCIQLPGRESRLRERPFSSIEQLIPQLLDALGAHLDRPFAFYGHSLGAMIAFEAVRELRRLGMPSPVHFFVAACQAPQLRWPHPQMNGLENSQFLRDIQERYGGISRQVVADEELCGLLLPALRADVRMIETYCYTPGEPLDCGISAFGGLVDHTVSQSSLEQWQTQTCGDFCLQMMPGDHFFPQSAEARLPEAISSKLIDIAKAHNHGA